ncbi:DNA polymerase Y family protein [Gordonia sinesedis]
MYSTMITGTTTSDASTITTGDRDPRAGAPRRASAPENRAPENRASSTTGRVLALWCPDWPATAAAADADLPPLHPVAVLSANRVIACSAPARTAGVRRGMRKRQAQSACPEMTVVVADEHRDGRMFEPVAAAVADLAPTAEVLRPGLLAISATGPSAFHGGEAAFAEQLVDRVSACGVESQVGIADELFTAVLAARRGRIVHPGGDRTFLADLPIGDLAVEPSLADPDRTELTGLLRRLGLTTIGDFAALSVTDVATRFAADAVAAHRQATALPGRRPMGSAPPEELAIDYVCDPPIDRIDAAAFVGRRLADVVHRRLADIPAACTKLTVVAITELGQQHSRTWRCAQPLTPEATADRVRWQLEGWMTGGRRRGDADGRPDSPIVTLRLEPVELVEAGALHYALTGYGLPGDAEVSERARRSLERVQALLGGEAVRIPVRSGGRGPADQITLVPLGDEKIPDRDPAAPWPGRLPGPAPTMMADTPVAVTDAMGSPVEVTARGAFSAEPTTVNLIAGPNGVSRRDGWGLTWWAGPWPTGVDEAGITARAQVLLDDSRALLLCFRSGGWVVEGVYE